MLIEIFLLAVASMVWPVLLVVDVVAFRSTRPVRILGGFLAGGMIATVAVACAIVFSLKNTALFTTSKHTTDAAVSIAVGAAALAAAYLIRRSDKQPRPERKPHKSSRVDRLGDHGLWVAFVTGIVLNIFPGPLPLIAMKDMAELDYSTSGTLAVIIGFYLVMFIPVEAPLISFLVAPRPTKGAVTAFNDWLARNLRRIAWVTLAAVGTFEIVRGIFAV